MRLSRIDEIFDAIKKEKKIEVNLDEIKYLEKMELIKFIEKGQFEAIRKEINYKIDKLITEISSAKEEINHINEELKSAKAYFSLKSTNDKKRQRVVDLQQIVDEKTKTLKETKKKRDELDKPRTDPSGYAFTGCGYLKITSKGDNRARYIRAAMPRMEDAAYSELEENLNKIQSAIVSRCKNILDIYNNLVNKSKFSDSEHTMKFAMILMWLKGNKDESISRAHIIDDRMYAMGFPHTERMDAVLMLTLGEGDMHYLSDRAVEMFLVLCGDRYARNYFTWRIAVNCVKIPGQYTLDKYRRYEEMQNAMRVKGWSKRSAETDLIALNLAREEGSVHHILEEFIGTKNKLLKRGASGGFKLNVAALILRRMASNVDEAADRFMSILDVMNTNGLGSGSGNYPFAAILSTMPGIVDENILMIIETVDILKKTGLRSRGYYTASFIAEDVIKELHRFKEDAGSEKNRSLSPKDAEQNKISDVPTWTAETKKFLLENLALGLLE